eukprot:1118702-Pelagomonas_calceolata.AAC.2
MTCALRMATTGMTAEEAKRTSQQRPASPMGANLFGSSTTRKEFSSIRNLPSCAWMVHRKLRHVAQEGS